MTSVLLLMLLPLPCPQIDRSVARVTYYVATNTPGANNESCDGLAPVDRGGGRCPFKDFESARTFRLLNNAAGVRVKVRAGTYMFTHEGLTVSGSGFGRVVLTAYRNEQVIFDGGNVVREILRLSGTGTTVERITFQHAGAHNIEVRGGRDHHVQCNRFLTNRASDSMKGDGGAADVIVRNNDFSGWDSQALDMTNVRNWRIVNNVFHDPASLRGNAIGAKFGSRGVVILRNLFRNTKGLSFGGVSGSPHPDDFEAYGLVAKHNRFENLSGLAVKFYSCSNCEFSSNDVSGAVGGFLLGGEQLEGPSSCPGVCQPTSGTRVFRNRLRQMRGGSLDIFWVAYSSELTGLAAGGNLYCAGGTAKFILDNASLTFDQWVGLVDTDESSKVLSENMCNNW